MAVLGGAGLVGRHVVHDLVHHSGAEVVVADKDAAAAQALARQFQGRAQARATDAIDDGDLAETLAGVSAAVSCLPDPGRWGEAVATAAIEAGVPYVDVCDDPEATDAILATGPAAEAAQVTVLTGMGASPGLTGLMARQAYEDLYGADRIRIAWVVDVRDLSGRGTLRQTLASLACAPVAGSDQERRSARGQAGRGAVTFPEPLGAVTVDPCLHPEASTLPRSLQGLTRVDVAGTLRPAAGRWLTQAARGAGLPRSGGLLDLAAGLVDRAGDLLGAPGMAVSGARVDAWADDGSEHGAYGVVESWPRLTGVSVAIVAAWLAKGRVIKPGAWTPAQVIDPGELFRALSGRGIVVHRIDQVEARPDS